MELEAAEDQQSQARQTGIVNERKVSETLLNRLNQRRKHSQKELSDALHSQTSTEDVGEELRTARQKTRQKLLDEAQRHGFMENVAAEDPSGNNKDDISDTLTDRVTHPKLAVDLNKSVVGEGTPTKKLSSNLQSSIRQRLAEKIQAAKEKGISDVGRDGQGTGRRLAGLRDAPSITRFDDPSLVKREDLEAQEQLQKSLRLRGKWKESGAKVTAQYMPTQEEAFNFFTRQWERKDKSNVEMSTEEESTPQATPPDSQDPQQPRETEEQQLSTSLTKCQEEEPLLGEEGETWASYAVAKPSYKPFKECMMDEQRIYFYPSMVKASMEETSLGEHGPRYVEDEGFYVGQKPKVAHRNIHRMENRLLKQSDNGSGWFGEDGRMVCLPDPLKEVASRPPIMEQLDSALEMEYKKALESEFDSRLIGGIQCYQGQYQLDVDVNTLVLRHHHLFSREHVMVSQLAQLYQQFVARNKRRTADFLTEKLRALKVAVQHVQDTVAASKDSSSQGYENQVQKLKGYMLEIRQTRKDRDDEFRIDRSLLKHILMTWRQVKALRESQGSTNTSVKLIVRKETMDKDMDEKNWERDMEEELLEVRQERDAEYNSNMETYRDQLVLWKKQKLLKKEAQKRMKKRQRLSTLEDEEDAQKQVQLDEEILAEESRVKPDRPVREDDTQLRDRIRAKFQEVRRKPGEPVLLPDLTNGATITPNNKCPRAEQSRRSEVGRCSMFVRVLFNDKEVSRTRVMSLGQDFVVRFAQIFSIQIVQWPESIRLQVHESNGLGNSILSETYASLPAVNVTRDNVQLEEMEFSTDQRMAHSHAGVGSNITFSSDEKGLNVMCLHTSGSLSCSVAWSTDDMGNILVPTLPASISATHSGIGSTDAVADIGVSGMADMEKLSKWIADSRLDPNDPSNAELMYHVKPVGGEDALVTFRVPEHFRLEHLQEEFNLTTDDVIETSRRYRLLQLRAQEVPEFKSYKMIPAFDKEVSEDIFQAYEKKKKKKQKAASATLR